MMRIPVGCSVLALLCGLSLPAVALEIPHPLVGGDPHAQVVTYDPAQSVLLVGTVGRSMVVKFADDEQIAQVNFEAPPNVDNKAVPAPWQSPTAEEIKKHVLGSVLSLWARSAGRSSLQVITRREDGPRVYLFQLMALPQQPETCATDDCDDPRIATGLTFLYPADVKKAKIAQNQVAQARIREKAAEARLRTDIFYGVRNWNYVAKGARQALTDLSPDEVSDNSEVTAFQFRGNRSVPSIYIVAPDGSERQVTPIPDQDLLVVYETSAEWRLRSGSEVVDIFNKNFNPTGVNPWTGTTTPEVVRVVKTLAQEPSTHAEHTAP
jgi:type IV secretion system protein VirB9